MMMYEKDYVYNLNKLYKRKLVICKCKEEEGTRLFVIIGGAFGKEDRVFTISRTPVSRGTYLCEVDKYRLDKNGNLNLIVIPKKKIITVNSDDQDQPEYFETVFDSFFTNTDRFVDMYYKMEARIRDYFRLRTIYLDASDNFIEKFDVLKGCDNKQIWEFLLDKYIAGEISLEEIHILLTSPSKYKRYAKALIVKYLSSNELLAQCYPLLNKKLTLMWQENDELSEYKVEGFIKHKLKEYDEKFGSDDDQYKSFEEKIERCLQYWDNKKKEEKTQRKANRKKK